MISWDWTLHHATGEPRHRRHWLPSYIIRHQNLVGSHFLIWDLLKINFPKNYLVYFKHTCTDGRYLNGSRRVALKIEGQGNRTARRLWNWVKWDIFMRTTRSETSFRICYPNANTIPSVISECLPSHFTEEFCFFFWNFYRYLDVSMNCTHCSSADLSVTLRRLIGSRADRPSYLTAAYFSTRWH